MKYAKHLKILALAAMACAALMAFAGTASATTLSNGSGILPVGTVIKAETKAKTSAVLCGHIGPLPEHKHLETRSGNY